MLNDMGREKDGGGGVKQQNTGCACSHKLCIPKEENKGKKPVVGGSRYACDSLCDFEKGGKWKQKNEKQEKEKLACSRIVAKKLKAIVIFLPKPERFNTSWTTGNEQFSFLSSSANQGPMATPPGDKT
jgi:hypothetical protein